MTNSEKPAVTDITYCEKHHTASYHYTDGTVKHTCSICYPAPEVVNHSRIENHGYHNVAAGTFCDDETLEYLKKNCTITIQCPRKAEADLYNDYLDATGDDIDGRYSLVDDANKYWYSCDVSFLPSSEVKINENYKVSKKKNRDAVYSNEFVSYLLNKGLKVGKNS